MSFQVYEITRKIYDQTRRAVAPLALAFAIFILAQNHQAKAETLMQALVSAYMTNPTLNAQRSALRATDESVTQAKSGWRPRASFGADTGYRNFNSESRGPADFDGVGSIDGIGSEGSSEPGGYSVTVTQPIFSGFQTLNAVREAKASVLAGREALRSVEQSVLLNGVTAYMDVVRDQAIVRLRENNVKVLTEQLTATRDRFEVGEVTKTDVSQAEASRAGSISQLSAAQAVLKSSRAVYEQVIGHPPSNLTEQPAPIEAGLPRALPEALSIADAENPDILQALFLEEAARYIVKQIIGETRPQIDLEAQYNKRFNSTPLSRYQEETTVIGRVTVPLYSGGEPSSRARAARHTVQQRKREIDNARTVARANVVAAWSQLVSARAQIESDQAQVRAQQIALNGVREEEKVGQRTVLDVLDAEQDLLDAQVSLVQTRRDLVVASYSVYSAIGRLDVASLGLRVDYYDPDVHYQRVKSKWHGFGRKEPNYDAGYAEPRFPEPGYADPGYAGSGYK